MPIQIDSCKICDKLYNHMDDVLDQFFWAARGFSIYQDGLSNYWLRVRVTLRSDTSHSDSLDWITKDIQDTVDGRRPKRITEEC